MPSTLTILRRSAIMACLFSAIVHADVFGQCTEKPPLQNYTGGGSSICPCFVAGEEAGAVLTAPPADYPIEILRIGIAWASQLGTSGNTLQDAIHIYSTGVFPTPGTRLFTLPGPILTDGAINEFNVEPLAGQILINSGAFTLTLEFLLDNAGDFFAPSMMTDGNGCQFGKNVIKANPGAWQNPCNLGLSGDWVVYVVYRSVCQSGVGEEKIVATGPAILSAPSPNPFTRSTDIQFLLPGPGRVTVNVYDVRGARVAQLADRDFDAGRHTLQWDGRREQGERLSAGVYMVEMVAGSHRETQKVLLNP